MASVTAANGQHEQETQLELAFCLYKYFPYGGLQRDFLRIALECQSRGHTIRVYTLSWRGEVPQGFDVTIVPVEALTNHTRYERFTTWVAQALRARPADVVVGINKMPGLDLYYAADSCYEEKARTQRNWLYRLLPRYRHFAEYETAVFGRASNTQIMMISRVQKPLFERHYETQESRMQFLPPGISKDRVAPPDIAQQRRQKRQALGLAEDEKLVVMVGSGFIKKGVSRTLRALGALPNEIRAKTKLIVMGDDKAAPFRRLAGRLGIADRVSIFPGQDDVPAYLFAADLLMLPALDEAAGIVLLEAIVAGLPVLTTENCGYAHYVQESGMGEVVPMPFDQQTLNDRLADMLTDDDREHWVKRGQAFAENADIYSLHRHAAEKIEEVGEQLVQIKAAQSRTIAFCLFKYFPYGGLQRDFLRIALEVQKAGCQVRVYTLQWEGELPPGFEVITVPVWAMTNHERNRKFHQWVTRHLETSPVDRVVGFNKMPGLDVYYAADSCYEDKARSQRGWIYRQMPRYRLFSEFEAAVFSKDVDTEVLMISPVQVPLFQQYYATPDERIHLLAPGIARDRIAPPNRAEIRQDIRQELGLQADETLLLMIGSGFITKGLDRVLIAFAALPAATFEKTQLIVIGQDAPGAFLRQAKRLGVIKRVTIMKGRDDIPRFLMGADLLVHPAYVENTGTVLLEAMVAGLPVVATDNCGYAPYIEEAQAGRLIPSPYQQETFNALLEKMMGDLATAKWSQNGMAFAQQADIYDMPERAAEYICAL